MPNETNANSTAIGTQPAVHHSTFAEGESHRDAHPEEAHVATFADGE